MATVEGVEVLRRVLAADHLDHIVVSTRDLFARVELWLKRKTIKEREENILNHSQSPRNVRPSISNQYQAPRTQVEQKVAEIWGRLFDIEEIGREDNFFELGGHSLVAATLLNQLQKELATQLSITDVLNRPTVAEFAALVEERQSL